MLEQTTAEKFHDALSEIVLDYEDKIKHLSLALHLKNLHIDRVTRRCKLLEETPNNAISNDNMALTIELANVKERLEETSAMLYMATRHPNEIEYIRTVLAKG